MKKIIFLLMALLVAAISPPLYAATPGLIDIRIGGVYDPFSSYPQYNYTGPAYIGSAGDYWNNMPAGIVESSDVPLLFADKTTSGANLTFSYIGDALISELSKNNGFNGKLGAELMRSYIYTSAPDSPFDEMTIKGLAKNTQYNLYVYTQSENTKTNLYGQGQVLNLTINGTEYLNQTISSDGSKSTFQVGQNVLIKTVTTDNDGKLVIRYQSGVPSADDPANRAVINGFQVAATPEPESMVLIGIGGVLMSAMKLRKKKASDSSVA